MCEPPLQRRVRVAIYKTAPVTKRPSILAWWLASLALLPIGCDKEKDQVQAYRAPKDAPEEPFARAAPDAPPLPAGDMAWDVPDGWRAEENKSSMRVATLSAGEGDGRIEVAISQLGGTAGGIRPNIDRWRGQIGLGDATDAELLEDTTEIRNDPARGLMVHLVGPDASMLAAIFPAQTRTWFIKATGEKTVIESHRDGFAQLCNSIRFGKSPTMGPSRPPSAEAPRSPETPKPGSPTWDAPDGWTQDSTPRQMSVASFTVRDGDQEAVLTITPLGGPPRLLGNINRWRRQVGLGPIESLAIDPPASIEVAGAQGHLVDLRGAETHMLGVIVERPPQTWFYKLTGPDPLVSDQKAAFEAFVRSTRFEEG